MNIASHKRIFNNDTYEMFYFIRNNDISMTSPDTIVDSEEDSSVIPSELVTYFMIENSMTSFIPKAHFEIFDDSHCITNRLKAQNTRIQVLIKKSGGDEMLALNLTFLVKNYSVTSIKQESVNYKIEAELNNVIPLNTLCEYATSSSLETDSEMLESPYEIIKNILNQVNYKTFPFEKTDGSGKKFDTKYSLPYTNELCHFITYPNMKAIDAIKYLLSYAIGENGTSSAGYLIHSLYYDKCYITTMENIWKPSSINEQPKNTKIPFSITKPIIPAKQFTLTDIANNIENGGINEAEMFFNYRFFEYEQEDRQWENYHINKMTLNDLLTKGIDNGTQTSLYVKKLKEDINHSKYYAYCPHSHPIFYDVVRNLELYSSNLMFTIDGDLRLDIGQVITIYERGENDSKIEQFSGQWLITKIEHSFRNKEYKCHIICSRRFNTRFQKS